MAPNDGTVSRRKWLGSLLIGGALAAVGGAVAMVRTSSYEAPAAANLKVLAPWQFVVVRAVARRIVAADRDDGVLSPDDAGVAEFVDGYLDAMRPALRRDFLRLLGYTEHVAPLASGYFQRFTDLSPPHQDDVLRALEASRFDQLRAGFQALKSIVVMGYYRDPRTFAILGYGGPLVVEKAGPSP